MLLSHHVCSLCLCMGQRLLEVSLRLFLHSVGPEGVTPVCESSPDSLVLSCLCFFSFWLHIQFLLLWDSLPSHMLTRTYLLLELFFFFLFLILWQWWLEEISESFLSLLKEGIYKNFNWCLLVCHKLESEYLWMLCPQCLAENKVVSLLGTPSKSPLGLRETPSLDLRAVISLATWFKVSSFYRQIFQLHKEKRDFQPFTPLGQMN